MSSYFDNPATFLLASAAVKLFLLSHLSKRWSRQKVASVRILRFYPVKSCCGTEVQQLEVDLGGCVYRGVRDRQFMLVDIDGRLVTARTRPKMVLITPKVEDKCLILEAPGVASFRLQLPITSSLPVDKKVFIVSRDVTGVDCGDEVAAWFSDFLQTPGLRLLCQSSLEHTLHYQDQSALSIISEQTVQDVDSRVSDKVTPRNFRSNIVVSAAAPYAEDKWTNVFISNVWLQRMFHTERCILTTVDPETGVKNASQEPLNTLRTYRILDGYAKPCLAISLAVMQRGTLNVGDEVFAVS